MYIVVRMTAEEVRDLGYLQWKDPWAWMENMKGKRWETLVKKEKQHYRELASQAIVENQARQMEQEIKDAQQYAELSGFQIGGGTINISFTPSSRFLWRWVWKKKGIPAYDIDVQGNIVWYITSNEDTKFKNQLICEDTTGKKIWTKSAVSSQIAVVNNLCYYIKVVDYFRTVELCVCNAQTGGQEKVLYRERDEEKDLVLAKCANRTLYLRSQDPVQSTLYRIQDTQVIPMYINSLLQYPLGESIYGDDCVLTRNSRQERWTQHGEPLKDWRLPEEDIQWLNIQSGHVLTIDEGSQTIWYCTSKKAPQSLFKIKVGQIDANVWTTWENSLMQVFIVKCPVTTPFMISITNNKITKLEDNTVIERPIKFKPLDVYRYYAKSKDGTKVPYIVITEHGVIPKAQFIYVYGAYGSTTPINWPYQTWYPFLKRKWAMVFALVRGGGDSDAAWADAARRENRHVSVDDYEAVIRASQRRLHLGPEKTVIYGRSAGGLPVGAIVSRYPYGDLVGAAFTEVPYVDVLRTSSNPELPLTIGEYKEFGNPLEKILNFKELMTVSPVNTVPCDGAPGVFVMSHVGLLDRQVFAYESFKWIQKLRGASSPDQSDMSDPKGKYVVLEKNEAHQYKPHRMPRFRAMDFAILNAWVDQKLRL